MVRVSAVSVPMSDVKPPFMPPWWLFFPPDEDILRGLFWMGYRHAARWFSKEPSGAFECFYCKKKGHLKANCRKYKSDLEKGLVQALDTPGTGSGQQPSASGGGQPSGSGSQKGNDQKALLVDTEEAPWVFYLDVVPETIPAARGLTGEERATGGLSKKAGPGKCAAGMVSGTTSR